MPALILLCAAQFMVILDITVVNIAVPSIQADLRIAIGDLQWLITSYTLAFGGLLLLGGRAADYFGRRRMLLIGLTVFTAASLGAALAGSFTALLVARVCQGIGAALLSPAALSLVTTIFPEGPERQRALTAWAAVAASGAAFGVLVGGALTELDWRVIFYVNVPIGLAVGVGVWRTVQARAGGPHGAIDFGGALLVCASLVALIYGLVEAPSAGWDSAQTLGLLALVAVGLAAFVVVEGRARQPLVPLSLLRRRQTAGALALMLAGMGTILSVFFFLALYLQSVLGHSALVTGLEFLPGAVLLIAAAHVGGHLVGRVGPRVVLAGGMALGALGSLLLSGLAAGGSYLGDVLPGLLILDLGIGLAAPAIFIVGTAGADDAEAGLVSGLISTAHELGGAIVLPVLSTVAITAAGVGTVDVAGTLPPDVLVSGIGDALRAAAILCVGASLLAVAVMRRSDIPAGARHAMGMH